MLAGSRIGNHEFMSSDSAFGHPWTPTAMILAPKQSRIIPSPGASREAMLPAGTTILLRLVGVRSLAVLKENEGPGPPGTDPPRQTLSDRVFYGLRASTTTLSCFSRCSYGTSCLWYG
jgi:hypothetical protein